MTLLISDRPLFIDDELKPAGIPFEGDESYITRGVARHARPPEILYETSSRQQNADALAEQGVTCVCLTRNRRDWLAKAIDAYCAQGYQPRELLIIADGEEARDLVPDRPDIRLIHVEEGRTIGDKRNFGVAQAAGKYIAHWDDDDYSGPDRLHDQICRIRESGAAVVGYSQIDFTDGTSWWRYSGDRNYAPGSSLLYERDWAIKHPFPPIQINEDGEFVRVAREQGAIVTALSPGLLTASIHSGNTSPRLIGDRFWAPLERSESGLTVIIPSRDIANLIVCVDAVKARNPLARIVVVDDGLEVLEIHEDAPTKIVKGEKPFIFSRNVNIGIREAGRDDVVILNDDAILKTDAGFTLLQQEAARHPDFGIIAATTNAVGNRNQRPHGIGLRVDPRQVCFVAVFIPRTTLDVVGYLDERFTAYGFEDDDFCYRVRRAGLKIGIHDGCYVDHASLKSTFRGDPLTSAKLDGGMAIFKEKWGSYPL